MTDPEASRPSVRDVEYKGAPLDAEKGPGLGCFWIQVVALVALLVLTPLSVAWNWPTLVSAILLVAVLVLLLVAGQTVIFLLRLVAADRRDAGRRRPLGAATPTVGELEDRATAPTAADARPSEPADAGADAPDDQPPDEPGDQRPDEPGVRE
ncbi:MAG TPA: hypothetical protein VFX65_04200 [Candidatus Limnocylindrales bacterium]|nr:hypothetical protein [Candidatus Limnocylindrales bacterium]